MNGDLSAKLDSILTDPAMMAQIKALADTMIKANDSAPSLPNIGGDPLPPRTEDTPKKNEPSSPLSLFSGNASLAKNMKNIRALLAALRPYLDEKRCERIDKMLNMLRLAEMAGYFKNLM